MWMIYQSSKNSNSIETKQESKQSQKYFSTILLTFLYLKVLYQALFLLFMRSPNCGFDTPQMKIKFWSLIKANKETSLSKYQLCSACRKIYFRPGLKIENAT